MATRVVPTVPGAFDDRSRSSETLSGFNLVHRHDWLPSPSPARTSSFVVLPAEPESIQTVLLEKLGQKPGDFQVVHIREWKVRVAADTHLGQVHYRRVAAMAVHSDRP